MSEDQTLIRQDITIGLRSEGVRPRFESLGAVGRDRGKLQSPAARVPNPGHKPPSPERSLQ